MERFLPFGYKFWMLKTAKKDINYHIRLWTKLNLYHSHETHPEKYYIDEILLWKMTPFSLFDRKFRIPVKSRNL